MEAVIFTAPVRQLQTAAGVRLTAAGAAGAVMWGLLLLVLDGLEKCPREEEWVSLLDECIVFQAKKRKVT